VRLPRIRFTMRWMMVMVATAALLFWAERMWQRRAYYLERAAHVHLEAHYSDLALDPAGVPRQPATSTVDALLPDGTAVEFKTHGRSPQIYYPLGSKNLADQATVNRLIAMCKQEAARRRAIRRMFERNAARPWLPFNPSLFSD
jgi:hypothetical protein